MRRSMLKPSVLAALRRWLTCTIVGIVLGLLIAVHVYPSSRVPAIPDALKLLKQRENGFRNWSSELRWMQEQELPRHLKVQSELMKIKNMESVTSSDFKQLWKAPSNQNFFQCVSPCPSYSSPGDSGGYLVVHTNGGLNQLRAGICDMVAVACIINATRHSKT